MSDDLISRTAAIDTVRFGCRCGEQMDLIEELKALPSAQPEERTEKRTETHAFDLISRQAAIDALIRISGFVDKIKLIEQCEKRVADCEGREGGILDCISEIEELPSAQPEQRWIPWDSGKFPDESGTYTVTAYDGATKRVTYAKYQKRLKRWELTGARAYWRVLAWMPLPEPWKGEEDE